METAAHRWMMTAPTAPMVREAFDPAPLPGEVVVEVAGCEVCHTDLGHFYDDVRTNHASRRTRSPTSTTSSRPCTAAASSGARSSCPEHNRGETR